MLFLECIVYNVFSPSQQNDLKYQFNRLSVFLEAITAKLERVKTHED